MTLNPLRSFYSKLVFALLASFLVISLLMVFFMNQLTERYQNEVEQKLHKNLAAHMVKDHQLLKEGELDHQALKHAFHGLMVLGPAFEFYVLDPAGVIKTFSAEPGKVKRERVDIQAIKTFLEAKESLPILGDDPRSFSRQKIFSAAPIFDGEKLKAYLYIIIGGEKYDDLVDVLKESHIIKLGAWGFMAALCFILLSLILIFALLTRPLKKLSADMHLFRQSGFNMPAQALNQAITDWNEQGDEIHRLGATFRDMANEIQHQYAKVKSTDELRKELISYVSHDLRTPLAALLGYLETWQLSKDQISEPEKNELIRVAIENAQHINNLVEQLFELARLDSELVKLELEPVALTDLCFDVVQSLQVLADKKGVSLTVQHPEKTSVMAQVDLPRMERVLVNLIDNAIRHCSEGDQVTIVIELDNTNSQTRYKVSIKDTGTGIPAADLPYIFDAYYRAGNSQKSQKGNSGLGLAISQKIVQLHGSQINVQSELGKGTEFSFIL